MSMVERAAVAVDAARAAFADTDALALATNQEVVDLLALTAELTRVVDAQRVRLAGAIDERSRVPDEHSICRLLGNRSARESVARAFGIRTRDASELLAVSASTSAGVGITGAAIPVAFPRVAAALDAGELSLAQARAIVSTLAPAAPRADLAQLEWAEGCLVDEAVHPEHRLAPELLVTQAQAYVAVLDPDGVLPDSERQRALRSLRLRNLPDGSWQMLLRSTAEGGSAIKAVLDAITAPRVEVRFTDDADVGAEAGAGAERPSDAATARALDDRTPEQKRHDALIALIEAHAASGAAPVAGGEVPRLVLTGTIEAFDAYRRNADHPDRALSIEHTGAVVPIETADRLLCNGVVQRAVVDARGHVLELGRSARLFSQAQRRALAAQYRGCATPGCGFPVAWTEAHHVVWWEHGGPTDVANGILLCSHCHHEVHAGRLLVVGDPGDWRVVGALQPADRFARNRRSAAAAPRASSAVLTSAAAAAAPLAIRLPARPGPPVPVGPPLTARSGASLPPRARRRPIPSRPHASASHSPIEQRLRRRSPHGRQRAAASAGTCARRVDHLHPSHRVVMRR